uniref:THAP domain-containing protein 1 n=1 Tax=Monopterus albus TaxID=43700 RepID=A0A3Q3K693_MONAL
FNNTFIFLGCSTLDRGTILNTSFHHFPKDETLRKIWIRNVRRDNLVIKRTTTVCSRHFVSTDVIQGGRRRLKEGAVPVLFKTTHSFTNITHINISPHGVILPERGFDWV